MNRKAIFAAALLTTLVAAAPAGAQDGKAPYTAAEYNAHKACVDEQNPAQKLKCYETFETTFPGSTLLTYAYPAAMQTAQASRQPAKVIEYADKIAAMGDKFDTPTRFSALYLRAYSIHQVFVPRAANAGEVATKARSAADEGLAIVPKVAKPESVPQDAFDQQIRGATTLFNYTIGVMSTTLKDYRRAIDGYSGALASDPNDARTRYQLGLAYLQTDPPQHMNGFWSLAKAINLKISGEAQVRAYLRNQVLRYQGGFVQCDKETDAQIAELMALAASSAERPAEFAIPTGAEIEKIQKDINILSMLKGLKAEGAQSKNTWLASCGLEFPEVLGKVISVAEGPDGVTLQLYTGETPEEVEAATTHNLEVKIVEQPEAARVKKDEPARFSGHVARYSPDPFVVYFEKGKVNAEDIPAPEPAATAKKTPKKAPPKKATKRPPPAR
jgi:tetratricopeptide (TPR) repeat protein